MGRVRRIASIVGIVAAIVALIYLGGLVGQIISLYGLYRATGGLEGAGQIVLRPQYCFQMAFTSYGLKGMGVVLLIVGAIVLYAKISNRSSRDSTDPRGFKTSKNGVYGTAHWMDDKERKTVLHLSNPASTTEMILGESEQQPGKVFTLPLDTHLNRQVAIIGAPGTMKSRAIIRNALFQSLRRGESAIVTDPKGELYADTANLFRDAGYQVRVFNLVDPSHSDAWNCMNDLLHGDVLLAQVLTNVVIGNTGSGKSDPFWDNGEGNLLKALVLYVAENKNWDEKDKNLATAYRLLTNHSMDELTALFNDLKPTHPAKAAWNLFAQSSETVRANFVTGLGARLQVLQNDAACKIVSRADIDLTMPAQEKCAYYVILSDQDTTMSFLSSLFFTFMFLDLVRYADAQDDQRCKIPVNLILDEFNNIGRIGGAADGSDFCRSLSTIRSRQIRVMLAVQSIGQLQNRYPNNLWSEIIGNCDIHLMLGCTDDVTAKIYSDRTGSVSVEDNSVMRTKQTLAAVQFIPEYRESLSQKSRALMMPDEVLRLPNEELLIVIRGHNVLKAKKFDFSRHPMSKEIRRESITKYSPANGSIPAPAYIKVDVPKSDKSDESESSDDSIDDSAQITPLTKGKAKGF